MLAIRMQRTGRKGHPEFRVVVQDARITPTSGRIVAQIGHYNPHTKAVVIDKEKVAFYLNNGAQPSPRVVRILQLEKVALPSWVDTSKSEKKRSIKNADKLRRNRPVEEVVEEPKAQIEESGSETEEVAVTAEATAEELQVESSEPEETPTAEA